MNSILLSYIFINHLIISILSCITFEDENDGQYITGDDSTKEDYIKLDCNISSSDLRITSADCEKRFSKIVFRANDLTNLDDLFLHNLDTIKRIFGYFKDEFKLCQIDIRLKDLTSSKSHIDLFIDIEWIKKFIELIQSCNVHLEIYIDDNKWDRLNLTISTNVESFTRPLSSIIFYLIDNGNQCSIKLNHALQKLKDSPCQNYYRTNRNIPTYSSMMSATTTNSVDQSNQRMMIALKFAFIPIVLVFLIACGSFLLLYIYILF